MDKEKLVEDLEIEDVCIGDIKIKDSYTPDEVMDIIEKIVPQVVLEVDNLDGLELDRKEFNKGLAEMSKTCGKVTALLTIGFTVDMALDYLLNIEKIHSDSQVVEQMKKMQL